jgi:tetratricopeptide (TPR) repeat protein
MRRTLILLGLALATLLLGATSARADDLKRAREHFSVGKIHFDAGRFDEAIAEYKLAYDLSNKPGILYNLGSAYRKKAEVTHALADKRAAVQYYQRYIEASPTAKDAIGAATFIASLTKELEEEGPAAAPPVPAPAPAPVPEPVVAAAPAPALAPVDTAPASGGKGYRVAGLVTAGVGVALVATSVVFALKAKSASDDLAALTQDSQWNQALYESGESANRNAMITGAAGAAAIAGGAVLYFVLGRPAPVATEVTRTHALLTVSGRF